MTFKDFNNGSELEFKDISHETYRIYHFPGDEHAKINNPIALNVSKSGGHRIWDAGGRSHYIPSGWIHLVWAVKPGQPNFKY